MTDSQPARGCDAPLPCPFCGSSDIVRMDVRDGGNGLVAMDDDDPDYTTGCRNCGASVETRVSRVAADAAWNTRVAGGGGEVVTAELVGEERMLNDAMAHAMVVARVTKDDAIRMLLVERDRLIKWAVDVEKTRPRMYVIGDEVKP